jgi:hypothetical protein
MALVTFAETKVTRRAGAGARFYFFKILTPPAHIPRFAANHFRKTGLRTEDLKAVMGN